MHDVLRTYPVFRFAKRWPKLDPAMTNVVIAVAFGLMLIAGAFRDRTLLLTLPNVGLLQHPGIWWFIVGQIWLLFVVRSSIRQFQRLHERPETALSARYVERRFLDQVKYLAAWVSGENNRSRLTYALLTALGACAWAWNTYSNERPEAVGFDFWDSSRHFWGFLITRLYKGYIWFGVMPCVAHIQVGLVVAIRRLIRDASRHRGLVLEPFHSDGAGGLSIFIETVLSPMVPTVFIGSMISLSAVVVHKRYDVTTVGGLSLACAAFILMYFFPATTLRNAIRREKRRQVRRIALLQQQLYGEVTTKLGIRTALVDSVGAMMGLTPVVNRVRKLPEWPQMQRTFRLAALAWSSPAVVWIGRKSLEKLLASGVL